MSRSRRSPIILISVGAMLIALAGATRCLLAPSLTELPSDLDNTVHYAGTGTVLDSEALAAGDLTHAIADDVPVTIERRVRVTSTEGNLAITQDTTTSSTPRGAGKPDTHTYAVDRSTREAVPAASDTAVEPAAGLVFALPLHPQQHDYAIYDRNTQTTVPATYNGESDVDGRNAYRYTVVARGPLKNPNTLGSLPPALPKATIITMLPLLRPEQQQILSAAMDSLPNPIPLSYTVATTVDLAIDATLGVALNASNDQQILGNVAVGDNLIPLVTFLAIKAAYTPESVQHAVDTATTASRQLFLIAVVVPIALTVLGLALGVTGLLLRRRTARSTSR
ncbi:porin PorA family protein [Nocardia salmonicida]|uniref:porin PorA family protein n=1 Tax=Nocardia salmonicida TaxID=53431 RepID=UPI0033DC92A0